jgi:hypothetical protein
MCDKELLIDYLYGELATGEREAFERHLTSCADCRDEVDGLRGTRAHLESWAPPQPDRGFQVVSGPRRVAAPRRWAYSPAWGFAAAAMLVGAVSAAIAHVEVTAGSGGVTVRTGWNRTVAPAGTAQAAAATSDMKRVEARLRDLENKLAAAPAVLTASAPATPTGEPIGRMTDADIVRTVRRMIEQSEERQQGVLASQILQVNRDVELARRTDLDRVGRNIEQIQRANIDTYQRTKTLEDYFLRVGLQR